MASTPMKLLWRVGHKPHPLNRKKYGQPRLAMYWASPRGRFTEPGVYLWTGNRQRRVIPVHKFH